ncbi:DUF4007 family protein [Mesorhizobium sp. M0915]|uniref:DUF4007 family protein n=1 Tax=Mesorhizobium sp. M0915 TaxID=2957027 RepID=UPI0033392AC7
MTESQAISQQVQTFRFSGHESFACRYAWLPKAYRAISKNPAIFFDEEQAMVELGVGKNMVRSLRFWVDVMGVASPTGDKQHRLTDFGHAVFAADGLDPYLEDARTLWLLHWNTSSKSSPALFAWHYLIGQWPYPEFTRTEALQAFKRQSAKLGHKHSDVTLSQHLDVFIHTYHATTGGKISVEDSLDGPLVPLNLLMPTGERRVEGGRWETVFSFRREAKPEITQSLFEYCVLDFWERSSPDENTLGLRSVASAPGSPGQVFKLNEEDVRGRLEDLSSNGRGIAYQPSAIQGLITRREIGAKRTKLATIYGKTADA